MRKAVIAMAVSLLVAQPLSETEAKQLEVYEPKTAKESKQGERGVRVIRARITFYHRFQDSFGNKVAMDPGMRAKEGITVAAHPKFPFGTKVLIPKLKGIIGGDGSFEVQDRGTAVTRKKASYGKTYVFDIFIDAKTRKEAQRRLAKLMDEVPSYMDVYIPVSA